VITPDEIDLLFFRVHRQRLLEESLASLKKIWPANHRWEWSPDRLGNRYIGDDWMMDFKGDCAEAFAHVEASKLPEFLKLACDVVLMASELICRKAD
jgi:hypothetical protein